MMTDDERVILPFHEVVSNVQTFRGRMLGNVPHISELRLSPGNYLQTQFSRSWHDEESIDDMMICVSEMLPSEINCTLI